MKTRFGAKLNIHGDYGIIKDMIQRCEELGFYSAFLYDHLYDLRQENGYLLECWTTISALTAETERIRLGPLVTYISYRSPSLLAKMGATLDVISNGRLEFGIGAGWKREEYLAYGYHFPRIEVRVQQLREAVEILKLMWTMERPSFEGKHYIIKDAVCNPKPVQKPRPPILIGGSGEKYVLKAVAELADICNIPGSPREYKSKLEILRNYCLELGRDYNRIEKSWTGDVLIIKKGENAKEKIEKHKLPRLTTKKYLEKHIVGTSEECISKIREYTDLGVTYFTISTRTLDKELEMFADQVMKDIAKSG